MDLLGRYGDIIQEPTPVRTEVGGGARVHNGASAFKRVFFLGLILGGSIGGLPLAASSPFLLVWALALLSSSRPPAICLVVAFSVAVETGDILVNFPCVP